MWPFLRRAFGVWIGLCLVLMLPVWAVAEYTPAQNDFALRLLLTADFLIYPMLSVWASWLIGRVMKRNRRGLSAWTDIK